MTDRSELAARAERAVRRGEMAEAVELYEQLAQQSPGDAAIAERLANLREALQPMELQRAGTSARDASGPHLRPLTPEQEGERLFALGDYAGAAAAYRRALKEKPDSDLIQERLLELFRLAQSAPRHSPTDASLPRAPEPMLKALLDRIAARKRVGV